MSEASKSNRKKPRKRSFFKSKALWLALVAFAATSALVGWMALDLLTKPYRERAQKYDLDRINDVEVPSLILDRQGKEIGRIFVQNRSVIEIDQVPKILIDALRAGEDQRFNTHDGVDYIGIIRAFYLNWRAGETTQGASTITQQLARNAYDLETERKKNNEDGYERKLVEAFLAQRIEKRYGKKEILGFYLNRIYFGSGYYGIRSASLGYFGKEPKDLTALESAAIVGCIKNPSNLSPLNDEPANRKSRNLVLDRMVDLGAITRREAKRLALAPLPLNPKPLQRGTSHLYERIADATTAVMGEDAMATGGFRIHTTISSEVQGAAQKALEESLNRAEAHPGHTRQKQRDVKGQTPTPADYLQGAVLMVDHMSGDVLAHVGGRNYAQVPYDFIELGKRPLGTGFFPFIHAAGLEDGMTPATTTLDEPMDNRSVMVGGREGILGEWGMEVAAPTYDGSITARRALEHSKIAATVRLAEKIGFKKVIDMACRFGFPLEDAELLPRLAVGFEPVSLKQAVRAMAAFPSGGRLGPEKLEYLDHIENSKGKVVYRRVRVAPERKDVMHEATAWQIHSMLAGSLYRGSSKGALDGLVERPFHGAGKGGSTSDFLDCWFLGYNARVTCGVWTGFLSGSGEPIYPGAFSRDLAMPVWQAAMNAAAPAFGGKPINSPEAVIPVSVCSVSGQRATQFCHDYQQDPKTGTVKSVPTAFSEYFRRGTESLAFCSVHSGAGAEGVRPDMAILNMPALDAVPVKPKAPVLLGSDPFHLELPTFAKSDTNPGMMRRRTNVLDSLDLGDIEDNLPLHRPGRLIIAEDD
jgi:penicillin-binding protein 1A